ncbi:UDP-glucosyltransferase 2-like [Chironomus tepperi]|uniref:UDP-glucosyltransferase 2-like n=1 Tax=Chironomus tepperi TaxID=113505 RepID=UPI00391F4542
MAASSIILIILIIKILTIIIDSSKILIISQQPYLTHQKIAARLADDLASHGHTITIFTSNKFDINHENIQEFNFKTLTLSKIERNSHKNWLEIYQDLTNLHYRLSIEHIKHPEIKKIMKIETKFDLLIIDCVICQLLAIAEIQDIPVIYLSQTEPLNFINDHFGNEVNPLIHPETHALGYRHARLSLYQKFNSFMSYHFWKFIGGLHHCVILKRSLIHEYPSLNFTCQQLLERLNFLFIFTHPAFGNVRPLVPKTIQIGFTYVDSVQEVTDEGLRKFMDSSEDGVVVFNVDGLNIDEMQVFMNVLSELKQSVVLNIQNSSILPSNLQNPSTGKFFTTKNIELSKIIGHPNIKLTISTADYREIEVMLKNHIPMILVPLTHEQIVNAHMMVERKVAKVIDISALNQSTLLGTMQHVLNNHKTYKENARKLEKFASDRPRLRDMAVWHVEFVIRNKGAKHLDYPGRLVPYYQKIFIDIYFFIAVVIYGIWKGIQMYRWLKGKVCRLTGWRVGKGSGKRKVE